MTCINRDIDQLVSTATAEIPQFSVLTKPKHLSLYNNGRLDRVQEQHLWDLASLLRSLHSGKTPQARDPSDDLHNSDIDPRVSTATADATVYCTDNPRHLALDATGMSTALSKNCTCGSVPHKLATSTCRHDLWHWHTTICSPAVGTC